LVFKEEKRKENDLKSLIKKIREGLAVVAHSIIPDTQKVEL
jgi:hypothetical protein